MITTALRKVKHKVLFIISCKTQLESLCDDMYGLLRDKEDELPCHLSHSNLIPVSFVNPSCALQLRYVKHTILTCQLTSATR
jgi:hypothetical protein